MLLRAARALRTRAVAQPSSSALGRPLSQLARQRIPCSPLVEHSTTPPTYQPVARRLLCTEAAESFGESALRPAVIDGSTGAFLSFESPLHSRFVNMIMKDGKKQTARGLLWNAFERLRAAGHDPQEVLQNAVENARPMMEMRTMRMGQVPFPLTPRRAEGLAMKWIVEAARKRKSRGGMGEGLFNELLQAHQRKGSAVGKRETVHKMALANQATAHFRWHAGGRNAPGAIDMDRKTFRPQGRRSKRRLQSAF